MKEIKSVQNTLDNKQPANLEAEQALLGSILVNNDIIDEISTLISANVFYDPAHIKIYEVVENLNNKVVFDHIISRAFSSVARFLELTQHLLKQQGSLLAMKGNISKNEISEIPKSWKFIKQHDVHIPMLFKKRTILELKIMEEKFGSNNFNS